MYYVVFSECCCRLYLCCWLFDVCCLLCVVRFVFMLVLLHVCCLFFGVVVLCL